MEDVPRQGSVKPSGPKKEPDFKRAPSCINWSQVKYPDTNKNGILSCVLVDLRADGHLLRSEFDGNCIKCLNSVQYTV
jgi:hypothetical protein